jgi:rhodanese-related sulfurtransferase
MIDQVSPPQWNDWMVQHAALGPALLLDVREDWEVQTASVRPEGYELVHIPMGQLVQRLAELDPQRPVGCLCHHGGRSMQVAQYLAQRGFAHVANIAGGINAWAMQLDPTIARY